MNSRDQFEIAARDVVLLDHPDSGITVAEIYATREGDTYSTSMWGAMWWAWQASRACATPEWEHAPDWAHWLAMDPKGCWWWSEAQPEARSAWWHNAWGKRISQAGMTPGRSNWTETLEPRP